ncbi:hypothetical protein BESB_026560 [Besnoitia besnoiti]|uniref:Cyclic nucleotide-binding domain-containing protein n=1 Tax=Besnoitia besnoiti TaxID=94643 RepID=A0A2A9M8G7_BESBE|nr:uncharacterized protein BESB_026560 [Besnoitia besnoiti]PFH31682.1 hypothetical protein BESB_026560 [Besnoitia besnoiti]
MSSSRTLERVFSRSRADLLQQMDSGDGEELLYEASSVQPSEREVYLSYSSWSKPSYFQTFSPPLDPSSHPSASVSSAASPLPETLIAPASSPSSLSRPPLESPRAFGPFSPPFSFAASSASSSSPYISRLGVPPAEVSAFRLESRAAPARLPSQPFLGTLRSISPAPKEERRGAREGGHQSKETLRGGRVPPPGKRPPQGGAKPRRSSSADDLHKDRSYARFAVSPREARCARSLTAASLERVAEKDGEGKRGREGEGLAVETVDRRDRRKSAAELESDASSRGSENSPPLKASATLAERFFLISPRTAAQKKRAAEEAKVSRGAAEQGEARQSDQRARQTSAAPPRAADARAEMAVPREPAWEREEREETRPGSAWARAAPPLEETRDEGAPSLAEARQVEAQELSWEKGEGGAEAQNGSGERGRSPERKKKKRHWWAGLASSLSRRSSSAEPSKSGASAPWYGAGEEAEAQQEPPREDAKSERRGDRTSSFLSDDARPRRDEGGPSGGAGGGFGTHPRGKSGGIGGEERAHTQPGQARATDLFLRRQQDSHEVQDRSPTSTALDLGTEGSEGPQNGRRRADSVASSRASTKRSLGKTLGKGLSRLFRGKKKPNCGELEGAAAEEFSDGADRGDDLKEDLAFTASQAAAPGRATRGAAGPLASLYSRDSSPSSRSSSSSSACFSASQWEEAFASLPAIPPGVSSLSLTYQRLLLRQLTLMERTVQKVLTLKGDKSLLLSSLLEDAQKEAALQAGGLGQVSVEPEMGAKAGGERRGEDSIFFSPAKAEEICADQQVPRGVVRLRAELTEANARSFQRLSEERSRGVLSQLLLGISQVRGLLTTLTDVTREEEFEREEHLADAAQLQQWSAAHGELAQGRDLVEYYYRQIAESADSVIREYHRRCVSLNSDIQLMRDHIRRVIHVAFLAVSRPPPLEDLYSSAPSAPAFLSARRLSEAFATSFSYAGDPRVFLVSPPFLAQLQLYAVSHGVDASREGQEGGEAALRESSSRTVIAPVSSAALLSRSRCVRSIPPGLLLRSSKEDLLTLEKKLEGKWGSLNLYEAWQSDAMKWQWRDALMQREFLRGEDRIEQWRRDSESRILAAVDLRLQQLWSGRMRESKAAAQQALEEHFIETLVRRVPSAAEVVQRLVKHREQAQGPQRRASFLSASHAASSLACEVRNEEVEAAFMAAEDMRSRLVAVGASEVYNQLVQAQALFQRHKKERNRGTLLRVLEEQVESQMRTVRHLRERFEEEVDLAAQPDVVRDECGKTEAAISMLEEELIALQEKRTLRQQNLLDLRATAQAKLKRITDLFDAEQTLCRSLAEERDQEIRHVEAVERLWREIGVERLEEMKADLAKLREEKIAARAELEAARDELDAKKKKEELKREEARKRQEEAARKKEEARKQREIDEQRRRELKEQEAERKREEAERKKADAERKKADAERKKADAERKKAEAQREKELKLSKSSSLLGRWQHALTAPVHAVPEAEPRGENDEEAGDPRTGAGHAQEKKTNEKCETPTGSERKGPRAFTSLFKWRSGKRSSSTPAAIRTRLNGRSDGNRADRRTNEKRGQREADSDAESSPDQRSFFRMASESRSAATEMHQRPAKLDVTSSSELSRERDQKWAPRDDTGGLDGLRLDSPANAPSFVRASTAPESPRDSDEAGSESDARRTGVSPEAPRKSSSKQPIRRLFSGAPGWATGIRSRSSSRRQKGEDEATSNVSFFSEGGHVVDGGESPEQVNREQRDARRREEERARERLGIKSAASPPRGGLPEEEQPGDDPFRQVETAQFPQKGGAAVFPEQDERGDERSDSHKEEKRDTDWLYHSSSLSWRNAEVPTVSTRMISAEIAGSLADASRGKSPREALRGPEELGGGEQGPQKGLFVLSSFLSTPEMHRRHGPSQDSGAPNRVASHNSRRRSSGVSSVFQFSLAQPEASAEVQARGHEKEARPKGRLLVAFPSASRRDKEEASSAGAEPDGDGEKPRRRTVYSKLLESFSISPPLHREPERKVEEKDRRPASSRDHARSDDEEGKLSSRARSRSASASIDNQAPSVSGEEGTKVKHDKLASPRSRREGAIDVFALNSWFSAKRASLMIPKSSQKPQTNAREGEEAARERAGRQEAGQKGDGEASERGLSGEERGRETRGRSESSSAPCSALPCSALPSSLGLLGNVFEEVDARREERSWSDVCVGGAAAAREEGGIRNKKAEAEASACTRPAVPDGGAHGGSSSEGERLAPGGSAALRPQSTPGLDSSSEKETSPEQESEGGSTPVYAEPPPSSEGEITPRALREARSGSSVSEGCEGDKVHTASRGERSDGGEALASLGVRGSEQRGERSASDGGEGLAGVEGWRREGSAGELDGRQRRGDTLMGLQALWNSGSRFSGSEGFRASGSKSDEGAVTFERAQREDAWLSKLFKSTESSRGGDAAVAPAGRASTPEADFIPPRAPEPRPQHGVPSPAGETEGRAQDEPGSPALSGDLSDISLPSSPQESASPSVFPAAAHAGGDQAVLFSPASSASSSSLFQALSLLGMSDEKDSPARESEREPGSESGRQSGVRARASEQPVKPSSSGSAFFSPRCGFRLHSPQTSPQGARDARSSPLPEGGARTSGFAPAEEGPRGAGSSESSVHPDLLGSRVGEKDQGPRGDLMAAWHAGPEPAGATRLPTERGAGGRGGDDTDGAGSSWQRAGVETASREGGAADRGTPVVPLPVASHASPLVSVAASSAAARSFERGGSVEGRWRRDDGVLRSQSSFAPFSFPFIRSGDSKEETQLEAAVAETPSVLSLPPPSLQTSPFSPSTLGSGPALSPLPEESATCVQERGGGGRGGAVLHSAASDAENAPPSQRLQSASSSSRGVSRDSYAAPLLRASSEDHASFSLASLFPPSFSFGGEGSDRSVPTPEGAEQQSPPSPAIVLAEDPVVQETLEQDDAAPLLSAPKARQKLGDYRALSSGSEDSDSREPPAASACLRAPPAREVHASLDDSVETAVKRRRRTADCPFSAASTLRRSLQEGTAFFRSSALFSRRGGEDNERDAALQRRAGSVDACALAQRSEKRKRPFWAPVHPVPATVDAWDGAEDGDLICEDAKVETFQDFAAGSSGRERGDLRRAVMNSPVFALFEADEKQQLFDCMSVSMIHVPGDCVLFHRGEKVDVLYFLEAGELAVTVEAGADGAEKSDAEREGAPSWTREDTKGDSKNGERLSTSSASKALTYLPGSFVLPRAFVKGGTQPTASGLPSPRLSTNSLSSPSTRLQTVSRGAHPESLLQEKFPHAHVYSYIDIRRRV